MAEQHDVWVLTRANNRPVIEQEMERAPVPSLSFAYFDLPQWAKWWKSGGRGVQAYYYLWQLAAVPLARKLHRSVSFDLVHHVTFAKYWAPSLAPFVGAPYLLGPVGGGETTPRAFMDDLGLPGRRFERKREAARWIAERDPFVRLAVRRSRITLATTEATAERLRAIGAANVSVMPAVGLGDAEFGSSQTGRLDHGPVCRFVSVGQLLPLKGFHLGIRAFASAGLPGAEYWIIGEGPDRLRLERLATDLGVAGSVHFLGQVSRSEVLERLADCTALVQPSLHDSGGFVSLEAMAAAKPVICLDLGGPAVQVTADTGFKIAAVDSDQAVYDIADAMRRIAADPGSARRLGQAGHRRVTAQFTWKGKAAALNELYQRVAGDAS